MDCIYKENQNESYSCEKVSTHIPLHTDYTLHMLLMCVRYKSYMLQRKPRKKIWDFNGFEPMTYAIPVRCSTN